MLASCIYEGTIRHRRFRPVENAFRYRLFLVYLDLSETGRVFALHPFWACDRPNIAWFRRRDHFGDPRHFPGAGGARPRGSPHGAAAAGPSGCYATCVISATASTRRASSTAGIPPTPGWTPLSSRSTTPPGARGTPTCWTGPGTSTPVAAWHRHQMAKEFHVSPFIDMTSLRLAVQGARGGAEGPHDRLRRRAPGFSTPAWPCGARRSPRAV